MPKIIDLGKKNKNLRGLWLILGEGLCSNIYVIGEESATLIDTGVGNRANAIWPQLNEIGIKPANVEGVIITHAHHDHAMGLFRILERADPRVYLHEKAAGTLTSRISEQLVEVNEGDIIETELWPLEVIWTPGHTRGGISLFSKKKRILFSGDTVFRDGNFGRFDGPTGSLQEIKKSLRKLKNLDVKYLMPGHGKPALEDGNIHIENAFKSASHWG